MTWPGVFPFGRASVERPPRSTSPGEAAAFVLGVYPSALHIRWTPPAWHAGPNPRPVGALAVDVEPVVFWDGDTPDPATLITEWKAGVRFVDGDDHGCDGHIANVRLNGSSGVAVASLTLEPLGLDPARVWMTDAVPWFFIKFGTGTKREQGDVIETVYNPFASAAGRPEAVLPKRPSPSALVASAVRDERKRLRAELNLSGATAVYTLGEEARRVLAGVADEVSGTPAHPLTVDDYGSAGVAVIDDRVLSWHALAHPGQRAIRWVRAHGLWTGNWAD